MAPPKRAGIFGLPILQDLAREGQSDPPTLDEARERLGGVWPVAAESDATLCSSGTHVWYRPAKGALSRSTPQPAIVLVAEDDRVDVWLGNGRVARASLASLRARNDAESGEPWESLEPIARAIQNYATLSVGDTVYYRNDAAEEQDGVIAEKCRYGALVSTSREGKIIAVGFQNLKRI